VRPEAKVLDFGISAMAAGEANDPTLTRDGAVLGTPAYMSPEQLRDSRSVDVRTDVYAFGVILYEALTGVLPFSADSYNGLVLAIASSTPKSPRALRPDLPFELEQLVLRALAKQREDRYPTVDSLIAALTRYASDPSADSAERGATTARSWLPSLARRSPSRRWRWLAGGLLLALSLALWWFGRTSTGPQAEHEPARVETPEQPAVRSPPAQVPAALGPVLSAEPSPTREVAPPAEPAPLGRTSPRVKKERRPMENAPLPALEHEGAPQTPAPNSARSGKISPDDL
jgi:serine/threonine-protein kinase